jgi:hypothetical protein
MCLHSSKSIGRLFLSAFLLSLLSLPAFCFVDNQDGSRTYSKSELAQIKADFQALNQTLGNLQAINKTQADKIALLEPQLTEARKQLTIALTLQQELQAIINDQVGKLKVLDLNLISLEKTSDFNKTLSAISFTAAGVSLVFNIGQAIAYSVKQ